MTDKIKNFPAPKEELIFRKYWDRYLPKIVSRDNFHEAHLDQLEVLCDLYIEYHNLTQFIKENGYTYDSDGRYGENKREHVEVKVRQKVVAEMRQYSKQLGLVLEKDNQKNEAEKEANEWS